MGQEDKDILDIFANTDDGVFVVDNEHRIIFWNRAAQRILGFRRNEVVGRYCFDVIAGRDRSGNPVCSRSCQVMNLIQRGKAVRNYDVLTNSKTGVPVWINVSIVAIPSAQKGLNTVVHIFRDITKKRVREELVEEFISKKGKWGQVLKYKVFKSIISPMARPLRIEYPGAIYHITSRGNARQPIFEDDEDRKAFLELMESIVSRYNWLCHAYCLMDNHYHLLIETPDGNLSQGMRQLNGIYTQRFNKRHGRVGHVFQGRFKAILVDRESYLLELCRYVVLNPVCAGIERFPGRYRWSSYRATAGMEKSPSFLTVDWVLSQFGRSRKVAQEKYRTFVKEGIGKPGPWDDLRGQILLGDDEFVSEIESYLKRARGVKEVPRRERFADRPGLEELFEDIGDNPKELRNRMIREAHLGYGYGLVEIGKVLGLHYSTISKIVNKNNSRSKT